MKSLLTHNWKAKLVSLLIAFIIWYVIRYNSAHQRPSLMPHFQPQVERI